MKKRLLAVFLCVCMVLMLVPMTATAAAGDTADNPILISTAAGLNAVRVGLDKHYRLVASIDLTDWLAANGGTEGWSPIGTADGSASPFTGTFDGDGFTISGLWINRPSAFHVGLFADTLGSEIKDLAVELAVAGIIGGEHNVGGLVGISDNGTITNCSVTGDVTGGTYANVGGLAGLIDGASVITDCYAEGIITGGAYSGVGGLAGTNTSDSTILNSSSAGEVTATDNSLVGGLAGYNEGLIADSYATGDATSTGTGDDRAVGGLVGVNDTGGTILRSYAEGEVSGGYYTGGLVGFNVGAITDSHATGNITTSDDSGDSGGLVGRNIGLITRSHATGEMSGGFAVGGLVGFNVDGTINICYATGDATGSSFSAGGLVGANSGTSTITDSYATGDSFGTRSGGLVGFCQNEPTITNCYATGGGTGSTFAGGLVANHIGTQLFTSCYFDTETSGRTNGLGHSTSDQIFGKTTAEMYKQATFDSWDFTNIWSIDEGAAYPVHIPYVTPDTTAPTVVTVAPSGTGVAISGDIEITFSEPMHSTAGAVSLDGGTTTLTGGTWTSATVYTVAYSGLAHSTAYTVSISGFEDEAENVMTASNTKRFTTVADSGGSAIPGDSSGIGVTTTPTQTPPPEPEPETWENPFIDVNAEHWFYDYVRYVHQNGLFAGTSANTFSPQLPMTRGMAFVVLARLAGIDVDGGKPWYALALEWGVESGLPDGTNPEANVTREQLVTLLWRFAGSPEVTAVLDFTDADEVSGYAAQAMAWAVSVGIIQGNADGTLNPQGIATRAEVAAMLHRFAEAAE